MKNKKILYYFWGHLGNRLADQDSPSGNAWYSPHIINELTDRGNKVFGFYDRDKISISRFGFQNFNGYMKEERIKAYKNIEFINKLDENKLKKIDLLFLEWRWPIPGRNININKKSINYQPDLDIQNKLIAYYNKNNIPIAAFDLDYKMTKKDDKKVTKVIETSLITKYKQSSNRTGFKMCPFPINRMWDFGLKEINSLKKLVYIGNRYERDDMIKDILHPFSKYYYPYTVLVYGNWLKYKDKFKQQINDWPFIQYHGRVAHHQFREIYKNAVATPLLAKKEYNESGFMTARLLESLYFGSMPVGFNNFKNINRYLPKELIIDYNEIGELVGLVDKLQSMSINQKAELKNKIIEMNRDADIKLFIDKILEVL